MARRFRYRFPETDATRRVVVAEATGFHVPIGSTGWLMPQQEAAQYGPAYEDFFQEVSAGTPAPSADGWAFPALFRRPRSKWLLLTEAALDDGYCGSHLAAASTDGIYRVKFPDMKEGLGHRRRRTGIDAAVDDAVARGDRRRRRDAHSRIGSGPRSLAAASRRLELGQAGPRGVELVVEERQPEARRALNAFTDLAAEMGWEYALVDANWNLMQTGTIDDVIAHAKAKGVGLLFWYNSGGPHNDVTEAPRDRMTTQGGSGERSSPGCGSGASRASRSISGRATSRIAYSSIATSFATRPSSTCSSTSTARTIPRGWSREFPNLVSMEAVVRRGAIQGARGDAQSGPRHNTILPFTRNVVGPMDYTPVTFSDAKFPHTTTNAHELALSVIFESACSISPTASSRTAAFRTPRNSSSKTCRRRGTRQER